MTASPGFGNLRLDAGSIVDRAAAELRRAIFDGEIESGTALREIALAESLGVSRPTVREALTVLVAGGLAVREPHRGVSVVTPAATSVRDVCRARFVLEGTGVLAWPDAGGPQRDQVRATLAAYAAAVDADGTYEELNERHLTFHVSLVRLTGNARLVAMEEDLVVALRVALAQVERLRRNAHDEIDAHLALVRLLEDDDVPGAHAALRTHLADAETEIIGALGLE